MDIRLVATHVTPAGIGEFMMRSLLPLLLVAGLISGCGDGREVVQPAESFLIVIDRALHPSLESRLDQYVETMRSEQFQVYVEPWAPTDVDELKALLFDYVDLYDIEGALLIGDLPYAEFEQDGLVGDDLGFPVDIYLQDRDTMWVDQDNNGIYDFHYDLHTDSPYIHLEIYTSRLTGSVEQLQSYFDRMEEYRHVGSLVEPSAFIFIDDDWSGTDTSDALKLDGLYSKIEIIQDPADSTRNNYLEKLTTDGAEMVFQKIHAGPQIMNIEQEGGLESGLVLPSDIVRYNLKASFLNLEDCSAARFSELGPTIAEAYTVGTDYGLAIIGSTKVGHLNRPDTFHSNLAAGMRWGEAYKDWYNVEGRKSDRWHLGIVLMGDPLLRPTGDANRLEP
jgi:hypothetical protein